MCTRNIHTLPVYSRCFHRLEFMWVVRSIHVHCSVPGCITISSDVCEKYVHILPKNNNNRTCEIYIFLTLTFFFFVIASVCVFLLRNINLSNSRVCQQINIIFVSTECTHRAVVVDLDGIYRYIWVHFITNTFYVHRLNFRPIRYDWIWSIWHGPDRNWFKWLVALNTHVRQVIHKILSHSPPGIRIW